MDTTHTTPISGTRFPIFRAGTHFSSDGRRANITVEDLQEIAASYDPDYAGAPLVVGHPQLDAPAYGWVKSLSVEGDELIAETADVEVQFAEMVNGKRFPNRSAAIYLADTLGNPKPGKKYLQHVGFLGATAPSVKGLSPIKFNASDKVLCFNEPLTPQQEPSKMEKSPEELAREQDLTRRENEINQREAAITAQEAQAKRAKALQFSEGLAQVGKLLPGEVAPVTELLLILPNTKPLTFSEAGTSVTKSPDDVLRGLLSALPNRINYDEKSRDANGQEKALQFSAPANTQIDQSQADLYRKAQAYQDSHPDVDWVTAVQAVGG